MNAFNKAALAVVVMALVASNGYAYRQWTVERATNADLGRQLKAQTLALAKAQSAARSAELAADAAAFEARAAQARLAAAGSAVAPTPPIARPKEPAPPAPSEDAVRARMAAQMADFRARLGTPEGRAAFKRQQVLSMRRGMPDLGEALGLDEQGVDRFLDLLAEANLRRMEQMDPNGAPPGGAAAAAASSRTALTADINAAFGGDMAARYQAYQDSSQGRSVVRNFLVSFADADVSLNKVQRQQLVDSYTAAFRLQRAGQPAGGSPVAAPSMSQPADPIAGMQRNLDAAQATNNAVLAEAASYLSPAQLQVLQKQQQNSVDMQRVGLDMIRLRGGGAVSGASSGISSAPFMVRP